MYLSIRLIVKLLIFSLLSANVYSKAHERIYFQNIQLDEEVFLGEVNAIYQDSDGFMWFGGRSALVRYDGYEFKPIRYSDEPKAEIASVLDLHEDGFGRLWAATVKGIAIIDKQTYQAQRLTELFDLDKNIPWMANQITQSSLNQKLYVASIRGLLIIDPVKKHIETVAINNPSIENDVLLSLYIDELRPEHVWIGSVSGLHRYNTLNGNVDHFDTGVAKNNGENGSYVQAISAGENNTLWLGTLNGLVHYNPKNGQYKNYVHDSDNKHSLRSNRIRSLVTDSEGVLWVALDGGGLSYYDKNQDRFIPHVHVPGDAGSLNSNAVRSIYEDRNGDLWIGSYPEGINYFDRMSSAFTSYKAVVGDPKSLSQKSVLTMSEDHSGNLWLGTGAGGLNYFDREKNEFIHFAHDPADSSTISSKTILSSLLDSHGMLWLGTWGGGMSKMMYGFGVFERLPFDSHRSSSESITQSKKLNNANVWCIYEDSAGDIWVCTHDGGISRYDRESKIFTHYWRIVGNDNAISNRLAWTILEDSQGRFWVGTASGLDLMDRENGKFKHYFADELISVRAIYEDSEARLWVGTENGLRLFDPDSGNYLSFSKREGFSDEFILSITEDRSGLLWVGTNRGISSFNPDTKEITNYNYIAGDFVGRLNTGAAMVSQRGEVIFGGVNGLRVIDPMKLQSNMRVPPVVFTDLKVHAESIGVDGQNTILQKNINYADKISLTHRHSMFEITFAALNYKDSHKNQYAYMLEGFDKRWNYVGDQRSARYTNLDAGQYNFKIKASNNDGLWNIDNKSVLIEIAPSPWRTPLAYGLYIAILLFLFAWSVQYQFKKIALRQEKAANRLLESKVIERTADLHAKNRSLSDAQSQLVHAEKMSGLGVLVAGVGHEIKNPLAYTNIAIGNISRSIDALKAKLSEKGHACAPEEDRAVTAIKEDIDLIHSGIRRVTEIVGNLQSFSRLDKHEMHESHLAEGLTSTLRLVEMNYQHKMEFLLDIVDDPIIFAIPSEINQVFMNLIVNACQAICMKHGKNETSGRLSIRMQQEEHRLKIAFSDNGIGMSEEVQLRMFDPFYTTKVKGEGTGLGLSITYGVIDRHGGEIVVESIEGVGSTITLYFPVARAELSRVHMEDAEAVEPA